MNGKEYRATFGIASLILGFLLTLMMSGVLFLGIPIHIILIIAMMFAMGVLAYNGFTWNDLNEAILYGGKLCIVPIMILMLIGTVMGSWIASGTVPLLIYVGLKIISPELFLFTACLVCGMTSLATGSSWSSIGTVGVALMGVGSGLGIPPAMTAGAIVSGAYFGDKMSPLSDTTNMAPAIAEADLFDHIRSMFYTTVPGLCVALVLYFILGMTTGGGTADASFLNSILEAIETNFKLNIIVLLPPVLVIYGAIKKYPALPILVLSALLASLIAMLLQGESVSAVCKYMDTGYKLNTGVADIDSLLSRGGMQNMMWTTSLSIIVMIYGAILEKSGLLEAFLEKIQNITKTTGSLIATTVVSLVAINFITASQYLSIVVGGRMFVPLYKKKKLLPQVLSRTLEDAGTVVSPLVPWGICGAFVTGALGVDTISYIPYAFLCWVVPVIAMVYGFTGKFVWKTGEKASVRVYEEDASETTTAA